MECSLCKIEHVGKAKTFNIGLNIHRADVPDIMQFQSAIILPNMDITLIFMPNLY